MKNLSFQKLLFRYERIFFIFIGIFLVFISWFFIMPQVQEIYKARNVLSQEKNRLRKLEAKMADLKTLNEFELQERVNLSLKAIPEQKNVMGVMASIRTQVTEAGLAIEGLRFVSSEPSATSSAKPGIGKLEFKLEITGSLESLLGFFKKIENTLPLFSLNKVKIELSGDSTTASLSLESYFLSLPKVLGTIDSPVPKLTSDEEKILEEISGYSFLPLASFPPAAGKANPFSF